MLPFLALLPSVAAIVLPPRAALLPPSPYALPRTATRRMAVVSPSMVVDAPVKIPDMAPLLAPTKPGSDRDNEKAKKFKLLLFNDNVNRREYVARVLVGNIPDFSQTDAYRVMQKAHKSGMAVVGVWVFEVAEAYCDRLKSGGLIASVTEEDD
uniref:Adaptor protein ClpS core domain-containing protein n=1 Tax=Haptolina ericina TaxID=156174 RepID=A0A7S3B7I0_9EUKA|mmetsp:Transcript_51836/g.116378  ORF Transcript_51836/g.116378 Transcript_51836/m.116378 type:complete len:153 (+) Transcript_51836:26-484(+)